MARRTYILTVDVADPALNLDALSKFIRSTPAFDNWWNHLPLVFLLTSELDAESISTLFLAAVGDARHLVMQVEPGDSDGLLPSKSWKWIRRREQQQVAENAEAR